jgi:hypothetical protein
MVAYFEVVSNLLGGTEERQNLSQDVQSVSSNFSVGPAECEAGVLSVSILFSQLKSVSVQPLHFVQCECAVADANDF